MDNTNYLKVLEAERFDVSYRDFEQDRREQAVEAQARAQVISDAMLKARVAEEMKKRKKLDDARIKRIKKLYFNAGRFAAGATDHTALTAHELVMGAEEL